MRIVMSKSSSAMSKIDFDALPPSQVARQGAGAVHRIACCGSSRWMPSPTIFDILAPLLPGKQAETGIRRDGDPGRPDGEPWRRR
ncbi:hypothetical protein NM680_05410 [Paracoccus sp. PS-1]|uniref:hypothetical protein n=1 Tax=unclassified Paracoccus (in: a-proteobacteria) TaxID=2688777 RepID=UPI0012EC7D9F|nr:MULTISPECIES: hypothetical protein [unclassified Paracoccus (in: a-proteobacteria)]MDQ7261236.1 hypothetical protein [Paracoccus sp. PS1]